jgi:hypothetical protein
VHVFFKLSISFSPEGCKQKEVNTVPLNNKFRMLLLGL